MESIDWLSKAHSLTEENTLDSPKTIHLKRKYSHYGCSDNRIATRGTEIEDFTHQNWEKMNLFKIKKFQKTSLTTRMAFYNEKVSNAFQQLSISSYSKKK